MKIKRIKRPALAFPKKLPEWFKAVFWLFLIPFLTACEKDLTLDLPAGEEMLVVEGHIEPGSPPVVVLTRSVPVFSGLSAAEIEAAFVHNATVTVTVNGNPFSLQEVSSGQVSPEILKLLGEQFGFKPEARTGALPFTFYFYTSPQLKGETGKNYQLHIQAEGKILSASTSIPHLNPIDSLWFRPHADPANDSLLTLWYRYRDPDTLGNCVRYFTSRNQEPFYPGLFSSVFIDEFANGLPYIDFPLQRGQPKSQKTDPESAGFFRKGDTVTVRWCAIDMPHYRFWYTLENDFNSRGNPFGAPVTIQSNIKGGLGIWGGYGVTYHKIVAPR